MRRHLYWAGVICIALGVRILASHQDPILGTLSLAMGAIYLWGYFIV